jgi:ferritin
MGLFHNDQQGAVHATLALISAPKERLIHNPSLINKLVELAGAEKDYASGVFLQWFVNEQVEEEAHASEILHQIKTMGDSKQGLFMLDRHLAQRQ